MRMKYLIKWITENMNKTTLNINVSSFIAGFVYLRSGASRLAIQSYRICALTEI